MSDGPNISDELTESGIGLVGDPVQDASEENRFYVFIKITRNKLGFQRPSNYKLRRLSENFEKRNLHVAFIIVGDEGENVQATVKTILFRFFPDIVRNTFVASEDKGGVTVWVEPKKILTSKEEDTITSKTKDILQVLGIRLDAVKITSSENLPTRTACLNSIRLKSPLTQEELQMALIERNFHIPNEDWLSRMLDKLRRAGFILRRENGQFVLTLSGLRSLGSAKNGRSPDISRALDIARRGS